ncbi:MAG: hypothetical protein B7Z66_07085 [Chromatiales bacterium 21-64-14]|nr:MAG: hypothetical protein B7Z66_07085 [Chromatiales bacterium 21-64-14]
MLLAWAILPRAYATPPGTDTPWDCAADLSGTGWACARSGGPTSRPVPTAPPPATDSGGHATAARAPGPVAAADTTARTLPEFPHNAGAGGLCSWTPTRWVLKPLPGPPGTTHLSADQVEVRQRDAYALNGNVVIQRDGQELMADQAQYDRSDDTANAAGHVLFADGGLTVRGRSAHMDLANNTGEVGQARYQLVDRHAHGTAKTIQMESRYRAVGRQITYTTCDPGHNDWRIKATRLYINRATGIGVAHNATLSLAGMPVFYFPYLSFPINDQRKSGFLIPSVGSSSNSGFEFSAPYYFNIAPNRDATLTPRIMSKRGLLLGGEFRYLNPDNHGTLKLAYIPRDLILDKARGAVSFQHQQNPAPRWNIDLNLNYVSDKTYLTDLSNSLTTASTSFLERRGDVSYYGDHWSLLARAQDFQTVDPTLPAASQPYARLPEILLQARQPFGIYGLDYGAKGEMDYFNRPDSVTGARIDLKPTVSLPLGGRAFFFTPTTALRYTAYSLQNTAPGIDSHPIRTTPIASLDTGLYLDRKLRWFGTQYLQTVEPRLYYLYVPYRNQSDIPVFDTGALDFNFSQLFHDNRFVGADRQGDANQLTAAISTRFLNPVTGQEPFDAMIGQIFYFQNQRVTLPGIPVETGRASDVVARGSTQWGPNWTLTGGLLWNPNQRQFDRSEVRLGYQGNNRSVFNISYRFRRGILEETDVSALWPISQRWAVFGRWNQSLRDHLLLEGMAGAQYESCCWILQVVTRRYVSTTAGTPNTSIMLQLELKGLGRLGNRVDALMKRDILDYQPQPTGW